MRINLITAISISALLIATMPAISADTISSTMPVSVASEPPVAKPKMISRGQRLTRDETMRYSAKAKASERAIGHDAGGEVGVGTTILAVIGALALIGVLVAASEKNQTQ